MKAKDIMSKNIIFARPDETIKEVSLKMLKNKISGLPIIDNSGKIVGIISQTDIVKLSEKYDEKELEKLKVNEIIKGKRKLIAARENTSIKRLIKLMIKHDISRIPIVDKEYKVIGIVSKLDILKIFYKEEKEEREEKIFTLIDKILKILEEKKQISLNDLSKELNEDLSYLEQNLKILEKHGIIEMSYSLGNIIIKKK
ncbi:MAG: CBS domain-containing protein [Candidatus Aenigmarchaeota archaeon]|nr:CBS domain-containing protein [Candidatus Aenigmarchaeota archaeon]